MKPRLALSIAFSVALAPFLTGCFCCTPIMMQMGEKHTDTFNPSAVYRKTGTNAFALEGIRHDERETFHAFLMIDNNILEAVQLQTNENLSITDLRKMYAQVFYNGQRTLRKMPTGYEKVATLPNDNFSINIEEHLNAGNWLILLLPPAFVIDVGTFPVQGIIWIVHSQKTGGEWHSGW